MLSQSFFHLRSDFLLLTCRDLLRARPDLRIILMSATIDSDLFSKYFGGAPVITIPGSCSLFVTSFSHRVKVQSGCQVVCFTLKSSFWKTFWTRSTTRLIDIPVAGKILQGRPVELSTRVGNLQFRMLVYRMRTSLLNRLKKDPT